MGSGAADRRSPCHQSLSLVSCGEPARSCRRADFRSSSSAFSQCSASEGFGTVPLICPGGCCDWPGGLCGGGPFCCDPGGDFPEVPPPDDPAPPCPCPPDEACGGRLRPRRIASSRFF